MSLQMMFADKMVTYETFVNDLAIALAPRVKDLMEDKQDRLSQRRAYERYGQGNVKRWVKQGRLQVASKRPGKIEYRIEDLDRCKQNLQDYLQPSILTK